MIYCIIFLLGIFATENIGGSKLFDKKRENNKAAYLTLFFFLILIFTLRYQTITGDAVTYVYDFQYNKKTIGDVFNFLLNVREPLFTLVEYLCQQITNNYTFYFFITSLPICIGITVLFKEESEDYFVSMLILLVVGIVQFCTAGLRQSMALGFCFIAYKFIKEEKLVPFVLFIIIAFGFHRSALVFIIAYPLRKYKTSSFYFVIVALFFVLGLTRSQVIQRIVGFLIAGDEKYNNYLQGEQARTNYSMYIIQLVMFIFCFLYKDKICKNNKLGDLLFNLTFILLCIQSLANSIAEFFRLSYYFSVFLAILVPKALLAEENKSVRWAELFFIVLLCLAYIFVINTFAKDYLIVWER